MTEAAELWLHERGKTLAVHARIQFYHRRCDSDSVQSKQDIVEIEVLKC